MRRVAATFVAFFLSSFPVLAADGVPVLNVKPTCQAVQVAAMSPERSYLETCLQSEEAAHDQLKNNWAGFPASDRTECVATAKIGLSSYVDLLTCLEMRQNARQSGMDTPNTGPSSRRRRL